MARKNPWDDPEFGIRVSNSIKKAMNTPEAKARNSKRAIAQWADPDARTKLMAGLNAPEVKEAMVARATEQWQDPEYREKTINDIQVRSKDPEYHARMVASVTAIMNTPEQKAIQSAITTKLWQDPTYVKNNLAAHTIAMADPENRAQWSISSKLKWGDQEYRDKFMSTVSTPEHKAKQSVASKATWADQDLRLRTGAIIRECWQDPEYRKNAAIGRANMPRTMTKPHKKVSDLLNVLNVQHHNEYPLWFYTYDIFIPSHKLLIEVQGDYWHSLPNNIARDKRKATHIRKYFPDHKLIAIWEHEIYDGDVVLNILKKHLAIT